MKAYLEREKKLYEDSQKLDQEYRDAHLKTLQDKDEWAKAYLEREKKLYEDSQKLDQEYRDEMGRRQRKA